MWSHFQIIFDRLLNVVQRYDVFVKLFSKLNIDIKTDPRLLNESTPYHKRNEIIYNIAVANNVRCLAKCHETR